MPDPLELELDGNWKANPNPLQRKVVCISAEPSLQSLSLDLANHLCSLLQLHINGWVVLDQNINIHRRQGSANASLSSDGLEAALSFTSFWGVSHLIWRSYCSIYPSPGSFPLSSADNIGLCPTRHRRRELWQVLFSPH